MPCAKLTTQTKIKYDVNEFIRKRLSLTRNQRNKYSFAVFANENSFLSTAATRPGHNSERSVQAMHDLRRLLIYLKPHRGKFALATFAMIAVGVLQSAMGKNISPGLVNMGSYKTKTLGRSSLRSIPRGNSSFQGCHTSTLFA